ncbi:hypothetical protein C8R43DRAFT_1122841 [Mycena crocata]|nr:hypothetical protein C8R43DRAFT_1122841 [Mycena crocata]
MCIPPHAASSCHSHSTPPAALVFASCHVFASRRLALASGHPLYSSHPGTLYSPSDWTLRVFAPLQSRSPIGSSRSCLPLSGVTCALRDICLGAPFGTGNPVGVTRRARGPLTGTWPDASQFGNAGANCSARIIYLVLSSFIPA